MNELKEKIENILSKNIKLVKNGELSCADSGNSLGELLTLIHEQRADAVKSFVRWLQTDSEEKDENGNPLVYGLDNKDGDFLEIKRLVEEYLKEQNI